MKFEINFNNKTLHDLIDLNVLISDHVPSRKDPLLDKTWTFTGYAINTRNGPFYVTASKKNRDLATFTGKLMYFFKYTEKQHSYQYNYNIRTFQIVTNIYFLFMFSL